MTSLEARIPVWAPRPEGIDGEGNTYIAAQVQPGATDELELIRIGDDTAFAFPYDTYIAGIFDRDVAVGTAVFVFVDGTEKLGTNVVDANGNKVATPQAMLNESHNQQRGSRNWKPPSSGNKKEWKC
jgi:hypothetical protein